MVLCTAGQRGEFPVGLILSLGAAALLGLGMSSSRAEEISRSEQRVARLRTLINGYFEQNGRSISDLRVTHETLRTFGQEDSCPNLPMTAVVTDEDYRRTAERMTGELVKEKYPDPDPDRLAAEATAKYPICEEGEKITVTYQASPAMSRTHSGPYRGTKGEAIVVGPKRILLRDIVAAAGDENAVLRFDTETSTQLRAEYTAAKLTRHKAAKQAFERSVRAFALKEARRRAIGDNETNGYILYTGEWRSLRDTVKLLIREERERDTGE